MNEFIKKLIGRLEEEKNETYSEMTLLLDKEYLLPCNMNQIDMEECRCSTFEEVISIVNELAEEYINTSTDTSSGYCEWKLIDEEKSVYKSGCEKQRFYDGNPTESMYEFCPYCGKKIKVKGVTENE